MLARTLGLRASLPVHVPWPWRGFGERPQMLAARPSLICASVADCHSCGSCVHTGAVRTPETDQRATIFAWPFGGDAVAREALATPPPFFFNRLNFLPKFPPELLFCFCCPPRTARTASAPLILLPQFLFLFSPRVIYGELKPDVSRCSRERLDVLPIWNMFASEERYDAPHDLRGG